ncbi:hypothetical protein [Streptomyces nigrescens]|uniref:hypothetical protein n=1 Tax=Streptomyces nigrescens TaxID=1920 RepID=UPI003700B3E5
MPEEFARGDQIRVIRCTDEFDPIPVGATGTVRSWNPHPQLRQLGVDYDPPNEHRRLMLTLTEGEDDVEKL